jgi:hypothetical protein
LDLGEIMDGRIWVLKEVIVQLFVIGWCIEHYHKFWIMHAGIDIVGDIASVDQIDYQIPGSKLMQFSVICIRRCSQRWNDGWRWVDQRIIGYVLTW